MSLEKIYKENINRKTQEIKDITEDFKLQTSIKNISKKNKKIILFSLIIFMLFIILLFGDSVRAMLSVIFFLTFIIILSIWFNSFFVLKKGNDFIVKTNTEEIKLDIDKIKNIYLEEEYYRIFIKKRKNYILTILYRTPNNNILDIKLNTTYLLENDIKNMFSKITLKDKIVNNQEKCLKYKRKRILKKLLLFLAMLLLTFIILTLNYLFNVK